MSDPHRLIDDGDSVERELVSAWRSARAPARLRADALALLEATAGASAATAAAKGTANGAGAATAGTGATSALLAKALLVGSALVALGVATVYVWPEPSRSLVARSESSPSAASAASGSPASLPSPAASDGLVAVPVDALPAATTSASARVPGSAPLAPQALGPNAAASSAVPASTLSAQLEELDGVREALAGHRNDAALVALDRFAAHHPASPLAEEAAALRVDVHVARRDRAATASAARSFLAAYPSSPYAARVRKTISSAP